MTCTIIGSPAMSASGLPGSLVEAMRAGMRIEKSSAIGVPRAGCDGRCTNVSWVGRLYGLPEARQTGYLCAAIVSLWLLSNPVPSASLQAMNSFELNKILGAILGTCLGVLSINIAAGAIFAPVQAGQARLRHRGSGAKPARRPQPARSQQEPIEQLLAKADVGRGENAAKKCAACHTFNKGGTNLVGPNLWGIVGRPKASEAGFNYSAAMKAKGGNWTIDDLNQFITNPKGMVPGTNMTFAGINARRASGPISSPISTPSPTIRRRCRRRPRHRAPRRRSNRRDLPTLPRPGLVRRRVLQSVPAPIAHALASMRTANCCVATVDAAY